MDVCSSQHFHQGRKVKRLALLLSNKIEKMYVVRIVMRRR